LGVGERTGGGIDPAADSDRLGAGCGLSERAYRDGLDRGRFGVRSDDDGSKGRRDGPETDLGLLGLLTIRGGL